jgi:pimeloyl-ACP methyl ester carboxylesterase
VAFFAAARSIYLDRPHGERGLWTRLAGLRTPPLFVWGDSDPLVPAAFARHVAEALPGAHQVVLAECGHVPQVELPEVTSHLIREHIEANAPTASAFAASGRSRAQLGRVAV